MSTAIITGASRGIGAATARLLGANGYNVVINYNNNKEKAESIVAEITHKGGNSIAVQGNVGVEKDIIHLFEKAETAFGNISALVNNAAINPAGAVEAISFETLDEVFRINTLGAFIACREAMRYMRHGGGIVNISSEAGKFGGNKMAAYAASKAAVNTFTLAFAREAAAKNIRVNAVSPGVIDTDAHAGASPERLAALNASLPLGRMGKAEEVAETIAWLLSDKASYVSGSVITVAGAR